MTKSFNINSAAFVAILTLTAAVNVNAQTCSGGTSVTGASTTPVTLGTPNECFTVTNTGSITADTRPTNNVGAITVNALGVGININGEVVDNTDVATSAGILISSSGSVNTITNTGLIRGPGSNGIAIRFNQSIGSIINSGTITGLKQAITNSGTITSLNNLATGTIVSSDGTGSNSQGIINGPGNTITTLINAGSIGSTTGAARGIVNRGTITTLTNTGSIAGSSTSSIATTYAGIWQYTIGSTITTLTNASTGTITGANSGIRVEAGTITTLTNEGTIAAQVIGGFGINAAANTITTLNNLQGVGNAAGALTYTGGLPTNYNIIIRSPTEYGQLAVTSPSGSTTFGIFAGSTVNANGRYANVLQGFSSLGSVTNATGTYNVYSYNLVANNSLANAWDLCFGDCSGQPNPPAPVGPSTVDTQQSLVNTVSQLQNTYTLQNSVLANSFSYDCNVFGANNVCVSAGGRNTAVSAANGLNNTSALLIAAYRIKPTLRIGAYADQNLSVSNPGGTVNLGNNTPLIGLFGAWSQRLDGTGAEVKVSAAYGQKNTTVNRSAVGSGATASEAGSGSSQLNSQGAQITAKYGLAVTEKAIVSPYVGVRYTQNNMGGYTEGTSSSVTAPLTYSALNTNATTALAGVGASYKVIPTVTTFASAGVETDTNTANGTYSATGVTGLTPVNFNANPVRTRPTATLGAYYDIVKNQRVGITGIYRQESYQAISTTTVMATYTIGL